jgi:mannose-6-phosphate isomerase-like protein (cupin superfamily)
MIKTRSEMEREIRERMRDGTGSIEILHVFKKEELRGGTRLFARLTLPPGSSIGYHVHESEEEIFYIISGTAQVNDNGKTRTVAGGDAVLTGSGAGHSIENKGREPVELMAVILTY